MKVLIPLLSWWIAMGNSCPAARVAYDFTGTTFGGTTFGVSVPPFTSVAGHFEFDTDSVATHSLDPFTEGFLQQIPGGFFAEFAGLSVVADEYLVGVANDAFSQDQFVVYFEDDEALSPLDPSLGEPLVVNGDPCGTGLFQLNLRAPDTLYTTNNVLPTSLDGGDFTGFNAGFLAEAPPPTPSLFFSVTSLRPGVVRSPRLDPPEAPEPTTACLMGLCLFLLTGGWLRRSHRPTKPSQVRCLRASGFSLVELLVVITIIGVMMALLLPAVMSSRESARQVICRNNLKQLTLALAQYEHVHEAYPIGAQGGGTYGHSWTVDIVPFLEQQALFDRMDHESAHHGWVAMSVQNAQAVNGVAIEAMHCPSSPLPILEPVLGGAVEIMMPSYAGISGATSHDGFPEDAVAECCSASPGGEISAGGVLVPNKPIQHATVRDGASNTLVIAEQSDFLFDSNGEIARVDPGYPIGWIAGTKAIGTPPAYDVEPGIAPSWNITTVRYPPNTRNYELPGIYFSRGANNPLVSAHPGGVFAAKLDGSVTLLSDGIDMSTLKRLATRNDGLPIPVH